jgi:putative membrane protein
VQQVAMTGQWWASWSFDPAVLGGVLVAGWAYVLGLRSLPERRRNEPGRRRRTWAFAAGLAAVLAALASPVDTMSGRWLSAHMLQHLLLILVAAPMLVLGRPLIPLSLALPRSSRVALRRAAMVRPLAAAGRLLQHPVVAWLLSVSVLWAWHAPGPYQAALRTEWVHALEHATFLGTAALFWWVALAEGPHRKLAPGADVLYVLAAWLQSGALGALFTFASAPLYPFYSRIAGASPLHDQRVAGLIMWIPAGMVYLGAAALMAVRWLHGLERETPRLHVERVPVRTASRT